MSIVFGSWYSEPLRDHLSGESGKGRFERELAAINRFEEMLTDEGVLVLKFLLVLSAQGAEEAARRATPSGPAAPAAPSRNGPASRDRKQVRPISRSSVRRTSTALRALGRGAERRPGISRPDLRPHHPGDACAAAWRGATVAASAPGAGGDSQRRPAQRAGRAGPRRSSSTRRATRSGSRRRRSAAGADAEQEVRGRALVAVFEGHDAAGKGGAIRRVSRALDPRLYRVLPDRRPHRRGEGAPYLWRFWRHVPRKGQIAIFDRSWYGRVLVERVEGFASRAEWRRAYGEINDFEEQLSRDGIVVVKFWLAISSRGAAAPLRGARADRVQALQDHGGGLAQPREVGRVSRRRSAT